MTARSPQDEFEMLQGSAGDADMMRLLSDALGPEALPAALQRRIRADWARRSIGPSVILRIALPAAAAASLALAFWTRSPAQTAEPSWTSAQRSEIVTAIGQLHEDSATPRLTKADQQLTEIETSLESLKKEMYADLGDSEANWDLPRESRAGL